ncbi:MAG: DUF2934 domain-containing protein [Bryobacteraceae bacterium]
MLHSCGRPHVHRHYQDESAPGKGTVDRQTGSWVKNAPAQPSHSEIAALAFSYWEARGRQGGSAAEDWFRAERELRRKE